MFAVCRRTRHGGKPCFSAAQGSSLLSRTYAWLSVVARLGGAPDLARHRFPDAPAVARGFVHGAAGSTPSGRGGGRPGDRPVAGGFHFAAARVSPALTGKRDLEGRVSVRDRGARARAGVSRRRRGPGV